MEIIEKCTTCKYSCKTSDIDKAYMCNKYKPKKSYLKKKTPYAIGKGFQTVTIKGGES